MREPHARGGDVVLGWSWWNSLRRDMRCAVSRWHAGAHGHGASDRYLPRSAPSGPRRRYWLYQKAVYRCIAGLQTAAGLTPCVQYGEFLWWYFGEDSGSGMQPTMTRKPLRLRRPRWVVHCTFSPGRTRRSFGEWRRRRAVSRQSPARPRSGAGQRYWVPFFQIRHASCSGRMM